MAIEARRKIISMVIVPTSLILLKHCDTNESKNGVIADDQFHFPLCSTILPSVTAVSNIY